MLVSFILNIFDSVCSQMTGGTLVGLLWGEFCERDQSSMESESSAFQIWISKLECIDLIIDLSISGSDKAVTVCQSGRHWLLCLNHSKTVLKSTRIILLPVVSAWNNFVILNQTLNTKKPVGFSFFSLLTYYNSVHIFSAVFIHMLVVSTAAVRTKYCHTLTLSGNTWPIFYLKNG